MRHLAAMLVVAALAPAVVTRGEEPLLREISLRDLERDGSRFYLAGILGSSFATAMSPGVPSATETVFTSGGAAGVGFVMLDRAWRLEVEGRARDPVAETTTLSDGISTSSLTATGGWSALVNLWRDFDLTDRTTCYLGVGIGGGGYQFGLDQEFPIQDATVTGAGTVGGFAWQAGCGVAYDLTDRITLDLGYRFFEIDAGSVETQLAQSEAVIDTGSAASAFSASELFFAIRIYEPFRGWR